MPFLRSNPSARKSAFTVTEILVVVAVTGLLASLLLPAFDRAAARARAAECMSNLRQLGSATILWSADNDNLIPPVQYDPNGDGNLRMPWANAIGEYLGDTRTGYKGYTTYVEGCQHCPEGALQLRDASGNRVTSGGIWQRMTYGINALRSDYYFPERLSAIQHPSRTILYADKETDLTDNAWPVVNPPEWNAAQEYRLAFRHSGRAHIVFFDGHVEAIAADDANLSFNWSQSSPNNPWKPW